MTNYWLCLSGSIVKVRSRTARSDRSAVTTHPSGRFVLKRIKKDERTQRIPVVMLTSSSRKADLDASYQAGANSYLVKSVDYDQFTRDVRQLGEYWLGLNQ